MHFDYDTEKTKIERLLRDHYGSDAYIVTGRGYQGRVQVKIVSDRFNGLSENEKQDRVWEVARRELGAAGQAISFILAYGTDEPNDPSFEEAHDLVDTNAA